MSDEKKEDGRLYFSFKEFIDELDAISQIADPFIESSRKYILRNLKTSLENIRDSEGGKVSSWGIPEGSSSALRTVHRRGEYEPRNRLGREDVFAEITSTWSIAPLGPHGVKHSAGRRFALMGNASTRIEIYRFSPQGRHQRIAMWRMELGADDSPGCFFHIQVLGQDKRPPFPKSLPVPRLPTFIATPMAALEFALGELFQEDWAKESSRGMQPHARWRAIQTKRLTRLNEWENELLNDKGYMGSPWLLLKSKKPRRDLFI